MKTSPKTTSSIWLDGQELYKPGTDRANQPMKSLGQIAMEAVVYFKTPAASKSWDSLDEADQNYWNTIASAVSAEVHRRSTRC